MRYVGSKRRIAKEILPIITKGIEQYDYYIEPFVGGANSFCLVDYPKIGQDSNQYAIQALKLIRDNLELLPKNKEELTEEEYKKIKNDPRNILHGYVGFACSFGGKWYGGYPRGFKADGITPRDIIEESYKNAVKQSHGLQNSCLMVRRFVKECILGIHNSIIYCDPPYQGTLGYNTPFNHEEFFHICRKLVKNNNKIFISEYSAPPDFKCVWSKEQTTTINARTGYKRAIEKLFTL